jgi:hypothetical protein
VSRTVRCLIFVAAAATVLVVVAATAAGALDCTEITDCLGNSLRGSISALVGVGLLAGLIFAPEIFGPILIAKGLTEAITGQDLVSGEPLDWKYRALGALPILGVYGQELRVGTSLLREEEALSQADRAASEAWLDSLPTKATPTEGAPNLYEIEKTGPNNFLMRGGGEQIWADGYSVGDANILEAKYVGTPDRSPFIPDSNAPPFLRAKVVADVEDEIRRYSAVIGDSSNPARALRVITNDERAVPFFEKLLQKYGVQGKVIVDP